MLGAILVLLLCILISLSVIRHLKKKYTFIDVVLLQRLLAYHYVMALVYYLYVMFNPSDSRYYFHKIQVFYRGESWFDFYGTSTRFIEWIGFPFINYLNFSYEAIMILFAFFGYLGFIYFYIFFKENIKARHSFLNVDLITIIFFLPNLHFWSASFGKGAVAFLSLGIFFFGISKINKRWMAIAIGGLLIYHVRPHVLLVVLVSSVLGFVFSTKKIGFFTRAAFVCGAALAFFFIYKDVLSLVGIDEDQLISQGLDLTHRATELTKATSGIDITSYSLPMQLFTFLYRPLFVDAPGIFGLFVSVENLFYLIFTFHLFKSWRAITFILRANALAKSAFLSFITVSLALAQISGNLGLAIRQKSQVMLLFLFVIMCFLDEQKIERYQVWLRRKKQKERLARFATPASPQT